MVVFVCSPLRATSDRTQDQHMEEARAYMLEVLTDGNCPVVPHLLFTQVLDDNRPDERDVGVSAALQAIRACDEVWVFGPVVSDGMYGEICLARAADKVVRWFPSGRLGDGLEVAIDAIWRRCPDGRVEDAWHRSARAVTVGGPD